MKYCVGRFKRIQAPRNRYVEWDDMTASVEIPQSYDQDQGKRNREPQIEDSINNLSLFRPPRRRAL